MMVQTVEIRLHVVRPENQAREAALPFADRIATLCKFRITERWPEAEVTTEIMEWHTFEDDGKNAVEAGK